MLKITLKCPSYGSAADHARREAKARGNDDSARGLTVYPNRGASVGPHRRLDQLWLEDITYTRFGLPCASHRSGM